MTNTPFIYRDGITFLNVPSALEMVEEVVDQDCYELRSLSPNHILIDCGACYGEASIFAASLGMKVMALEPSKPSYRVLESNWALNQMEVVGMVHLWNKPVGLHDRQFTHYYWPHHPGGSGKESRDGSEKCMYQSVGVDRIIKEVKLKFSTTKPIAIKMDIEGSEKEAFMDADKWLPKVDYVAMETHNFDSDFFALILTNNGFEVKLTGTGKPPRVAWDKSIAGGLVIARRKQPSGTQAQST